MVTKQQQLEWLVSKIVKWPADGAKIPVSIDDAGNPKFYMPWDAFAPWDVMRVDFTREEWQQERDKMQKKAERVAQPAPGRSWHERGELPPVGCECEILGAFGHYQEWFPCKIIAEHSGSVFAANERSWINVKHGERQFRPLRTEREKAIDAVIDIICAGGYFTRRDGAAREIAERIYDAGMLK